jgi:hypothetical protein
VSTDIYLTCEHGARVGDINVTGNLGSLLRAAGAGLGELKGMVASEVAVKCELALERIQRAPDYYKQFEAKNGWGTCEHAIYFLIALRDLCREYPLMTVEF